MLENYKPINNIIDNIASNENSSDFFISKCKISQFFQSLTPTEIKTISKEGILYIKNFENIFSNKDFQKNYLSYIEKKQKIIHVANYMGETKKRREEILIEQLSAENQMICSALHLAFYVFSHVYDNLSMEEIKIFRKIVERKLFEIRNLVNEKFNLILRISDVSLDFYTIIRNFKNSYKCSVKLDKFNIFNMFLYNTSARCLAEVFFLVVPQIQILCIGLKGRIKDSEELADKNSITIALSKLYGITDKISGGLSHASNSVRDAGFNQSLFDDFIIKAQDCNEIICYYIINKITSGFKWKETSSYSEILESKLESVLEIKNDIKVCVEKNLKAFERPLLPSDNEWSNKVYLVTNKMLATLEAVLPAKDVVWKYKVAKREFNNWIFDIHLILNKEDIDDDWESVKNFVIQENSRVEWKSSFLTSTQDEYKEENEKKLENSTLSLIAKNILGMINSDGGVIIIGLVEHPEAVVRKGVLDNLICKNGITFFNVNYELEKKGESMDGVKRRLQDILYNETLQTVEKFNNLWSIEDMDIRDRYKVATIYKISVNKSNDYIFNAKKENNNITWVTLTKRADGRTIVVDPREYMK